MDNNNDIFPAFEISFTNIDESAYHISYGIYKSLAEEIVESKIVTDYYIKCLLLNYIKELSVPDNEQDYSELCHKVLNEYFPDTFKIVSPFDLNKTKEEIKKRLEDELREILEYQEKAKYDFIQHEYFIYDIFQQFDDGFDGAWQSICETFRPN